MAATGKTPILLYGSTTTTNVPVAGNLTNSSDGCEIAINVADKNLFFKDATNVVNTVPIRQSSGSSDGWLSSTNWTTFNSKQTAYTNLTSIGGLANATGWLYNNGSGTFTYSTPSASDVGAVPTSRTVSTTSPLAGGGALSSNLTLSITQATTSTSGYLSSTDWNTFNNKQPAGTYVTSVTGTAPVVSSGGTTPAISMAAATGSVNGYLTSTDWTTFNSKVSSQWVTSGSNIYYSTGNVGVGVSSPGQILDIGANDSTAKTIALRYSSVPSYYSSTYDGTSGLNTVSVNAYNNSSGSASFSSAGNTAYGIGAVQVASFTTGSEVRFLTSPAANTTPVLAGTVDKSGNYKAVAGVYAAGASGFYSTTYVSNARNPVWRFGNADTYGISYFQGSSGTGSADTIGMHFGTATASGSPFQFISNGNQVLGTGNLVIGTSGKGIDFSATAGTGTSELLADYEEGTWSPGQGSGLTVVGSFSSVGYYTKIGNMVFVRGTITATTSIAFYAGTQVTYGLPYTSTSNAVGSIAGDLYTQYTGVRAITSSLYSVEGQTAQTSYVFSITYQV